MIHSEEFGSGNPIVLIHGFCESTQIWEKIIPFLQQNNRVIALDLPGFGKSDNTLSEVTIESVAEKIYSHLRHNDIEKAAIVGHSLGGYVGLAMLESHPEIFAGLSLLHSTAYSDPIEKRENRTKSMAFIEKYGVEPFTDSFVPTLFADTSKEIVETLTKRASLTSKITVIKYTEAMRDRKDRSLLIADSKVPIQFIAGTEDNAVPFSDSLKQSQLSSNIEFHPLQGIGHMGMYEDPETVHGLIHNFALKCFG